MSLLVRQPFVDGEPRSIFVEDGRIAALGEGRPADRTIEAAGLYAFPSLKNGHTHSAMTLLRGYGDDMPLMKWLEERIWPAEAELSEEDVYHGTRLALLEMIRGGTTYLADMYWHRDAVARAVRDMGVKGHIASVFIDHGSEETARAQRERVAERYAGRERYGPRVMMALGPHAVYTVSRESLEWIGEFSREHGLIVHIHLSETPAEVENCEKAHGLRPPALLEACGLVSGRLVGAHGVFLDDGEREMLAAAGATIVTNPISNLKLAVGGLFDHEAAKRAGLRVAIGTDGAASNNNLDLLEEIKVAALLQKHRSGDPTSLSAPEALALATVNASEAFGLGPGGIEVGAPADLMLVDLGDPSTQPVHDPVSNLVYAANASRVHTTICDGEVLMHERRLEVADEEEILVRGAEAARALVARAGGAS